ncbi:MAG: YfiR family protein [Planctomycetota bacterium]
METERKPANAVRTQPRLADTGARRISCSIAGVFVLLGCLLASEVHPSTQSGQYKEYEVKAAFIYNFLKFVDWPKEKMTNNKQIIIGVIGENPFGSAADVFKNKKVEDRDVVLKYFEGLEEIKKMSEKDRTANEESLKTCHLLFICPSEQKQVREITELLSKNGVLTVGDTDGFTESGVVINFFMEDNKIRFNINLTAAEKSGLKIRSQLLRLAKKVYKDESEATNANTSTTEGGAK